MLGVRTFRLEVLEPILQAVGMGIKFDSIRTHLRTEHFQTLESSARLQRIIMPGKGFVRTRKPPLHPGVLPNGRRNLLVSNQIREVGGVRVGTSDLENPRGGGVEKPPRKQLPIYDSSGCSNSNHSLTISLDEKWEMSLDTRFCGHLTASFIIRRDHSRASVLLSSSGRQAIPLRRRHTK